MTTPKKKPPPKKPGARELAFGSARVGTYVDPASPQTDDVEELRTLNVREGVFTVFKECCVANKTTMMAALEVLLTDFCRKQGRAVPASRRATDRRKRGA